MIVEELQKQQSPHLISTYSKCYYPGELLGSLRNREESERQLVGRTFDLNIVDMNLVLHMAYKPAWSVLELTARSNPKHNTCNPKTKQKDGVIRNVNFFTF